MKELLFSLRNLFWAFEILICIGALIIGFFILAFRPYSAVSAGEVNVETYVPAISDGIDGVNGITAEGGDIYIPSAPQI